MCSLCFSHFFMFQTFNWFLVFYHFMLWLARSKWREWLRCMNVWIHWRKNGWTLNQDGAYHIWRREWDAWKRDFFLRCRGCLELGRDWRRKTRIAASRKEILYSHHFHSSNSIIRYNIECKKALNFINYYGGMEHQTSQEGSQYPWIHMITFFVLFVYFLLH